MKAKGKLVLILSVLVITMSSFMLQNNQSKDVMIYGVVYEEQCGREASVGYATKLVSMDNYSKARAAFEQQLKISYPAASRVRLGSSDISFGKLASNACIISWTKTNNKCTYKVIIVKFGKTQQEALANAIKHKNTWAGTHTSHTILEQIYW